MSDQEEKFDKDAFVAGVKAKYNGAADVALAVLGSENYELRRERRELRDKQIPEGAQVITADEAKQYTKFKQFLTDSKLDLKQIQDAVAKVPDLETENKKLLKRDTYREIQMLGYDFDVLEDQMGKYPEAVYSIKTEKDPKDESKERKVPYVTLDGKESSLDDFAKEKFPKYAAVLKAEAPPIPERKPGNNPGGEPKPAGTVGDDTAAAKTASAGMTRRTFAI